MRCGVFLEEILLSDETKISLADNTIWVVTGPNNSGKSTLLRELSHIVSRIGEPATIAGQRAVNVPVVAMVDIDVLSDRQKFRKLFEALGGDFSSVDKELKVIEASVEGRRVYLSGQEIKIRIEQIISDIGGAPGLPTSKQAALSQLIRDSSPWRRPKEDGFPGLGGANAVSAFRRIVAEGERIGLLINPAGELEGLCRVLGRENKSEWLSNVLTRDLANDVELREAREFADQLRKVAKNIITEVAGAHTQNAITPSNDVVGDI